jgi:hypothetical protein
MLIHLQMNTFSLSCHLTPSIETLFYIFKPSISLSISREMIDDVLDTKPKSISSPATFCITEE